jgi:hypothetical protein
MSILAFPNPVFQPAMRIISAITNGFPASVTTTFAHNYLTGVIVRLDIPFGYGMQEANQLFGAIEVTSPTTFLIPVDTTFFSVFSVPSSYPKNAQYAQTVSFAEVTPILTQAVQNVLPYAAST